MRDFTTRPRRIFRDWQTALAEWTAAKRREEASTEDNKEDQGGSMKKLKSRKFLLALATFVLIILNDVIGLKLPTQEILAIVGISASYIAGESLVDAIGGKKK